MSRASAWRRCCLLTGLWLGAAPALAAPFDYYTFALSLTPAFCDQNPKWRDSRQCRDRLPVAVHGLWPERHQGKAPESCPGGGLMLSSTLERRLRGIMPDLGLRHYQWRKHGRCSGLAAEDYFALVEREYLQLKWPAALQAQGRDVVIERQALLRDFHRLNPGFPERGVVLRCARDGRPPLLQEIRVCLTPQGVPTGCVANFRPNCPTAVRVRAR